MFLSSLSLSQKKIFLGLAKEILVADDNQIDHAEEAYLRGLCSEMYLSYTDEKKVSKTELVKFFPEVDARRVILLELLALGFSNQDFHQSQDIFTDEIAKHLNIPIPELRAMEPLVQEHMKLRDKFVAVIEGDTNRSD